MCPNQILFDEQIALIGCSAAGNSVQILRHRRQLAITSRLLRAYPYPHRPYDPGVGRNVEKATRKPRAMATCALQTGSR